MRRVIRVLVIAGVALVFALAGGAYWARTELRASLPVINGTVRVRGLQSAVTIERDGLGIPTIRGISRSDVARATGFVHAQDRFFQMDLARRRAAGELSALVGDAALQLDRQIRVHRFRDEARRAVALLAPRDRTVLEAYAAGVNRGLATLDASPFEYLILRQAPQPWKAEDSVLVVLAMFVTLQNPSGEYESTLGDDARRPAAGDVRAAGAARHRVGLADRGRALHDSRRAAGRDLQPAAQAQRQARDRSTEGIGRWPPAGADNPWAPARGDAVLGSNSWAVSGDLTGDGRALVANDMHLDIRVPNTWYRAVLEWRDEADPSQTRLLAGLTLPGHPTLVTGSNTHVAWGFTNAQVDCERSRAARARPDGPQPLLDAVGLARIRPLRRDHRGGRRRRRELDVRWTIWGPVLGADHKGRLARLRLDGAFGRASRRRRCCRSSRRAPSKRRSTRPTGWARRRRT